MNSRKKFRAVRSTVPFVCFIHYFFFSIPKNFLSNGARNDGERRSTIFIKTSRIYQIIKYVSRAEEFLPR